MAEKLNTETATSSGYMTKKDVRIFIGGESNPIGSTTLWDWIKKRNFPRPFYVSSRCPLWRKAEVVAWLESIAQTKAEGKNE